MKCTDCSTRSCEIISNNKNFLSIGSSKMLSIIHCSVTERYWGDQLNDLKLK